MNKLIKFRYLVSKQSNSLSSYLGSVNLSPPPLLPNPGKYVAILWDLNSKPPNTSPPFDAAIRLRKAAASFGSVRYMLAYANHHAFKHVPFVVRQHRNKLNSAQPHVCRVCGRKFHTDEKLVNHFKHIHESEQAKRLNQLEGARGKRRVQLLAKFSMKMDKYRTASRDVLTPKVGCGLADELQRAGFWVNLVSDKPRAADTALRNRMVELMEKKLVDCLVLVSDDSDFTDVLKEARLRCLKTVVVGDDNEGLLKRCADASFTWKEIMLGKAKTEAVSVVGRWKDRDVLKRLEWTYRPELHISKRDVDDSDSEYDDGDVKDIFEKGHQIVTRQDVRPWWELDDNNVESPGKSFK
ncbi:hypothetical protein ACHQM5_007818 [Ranunculus cassubicifolius]